MRKFLFILAIIFLAMQVSFAQGSKAVYLEIGGNGFGFSANFESRFSKIKENGLGFRVGLGFFPATSDGLFNYSTTFTIPVAINHLAGKGQHHFESGVGITYISGAVSSIFDEEKEKGSGVVLMPNIGYRFAKRKKGFVFRATASPVVMLGEGLVVFWAGISFGYKF